MGLVQHDAPPIDFKERSDILGVTVQMKFALIVHFQVVLAEDELTCHTLIRREHNVVLAQQLRVALERLALIRRQKVAVVHQHSQLMSCLDKLAKLVLPLRN